MSLYLKSESGAPKRNSQLGAVSNKTCSSFRSNSYYVAVFFMLVQTGQWNHVFYMNVVLSAKEPWQIWFEMNTFNFFWTFKSKSKRLDWARTYLFVVSLTSRSHSITKVTLLLVNYLISRKYMKNNKLTNHVTSSCCYSC